jgi:hypothetical protein
MSSSATAGSAPCRPASRIPKPDGEIVITRYSLRELLDKLGELTAGDGEAKGG